MRSTIDCRQLSFSPFLEAFSVRTASTSTLEGLAVLVAGAVSAAELLAGACDCAATDWPLVGAGCRPRIAPIRSPRMLMIVSAVLLSLQMDNQHGLVHDGSARWDMLLGHSFRFEPALPSAAQLSVARRPALPS